MSGNFSHVGFVVGLRAEARLLRGRTVAIGGGTPAGARGAAERLVANGATALVSFGLAGGLDPSRRPGDLIIPHTIRTETADYSTDPALSARLGLPTHTTLWAAASPIATAAAKAALFKATNAAAVDLESGAVAETAARHNVPCAALRAICDPAATDLPEAALIALDGQGAIALPRILAALLRRPGDLRALLHLARDAAAARTSLGKAAARLPLCPPSPRPL